MNATRSSTSISGSSRRDFLKFATSAVLAASGTLGLGGVLRFLDFESEPPRKKEFDLGPASDYAMDSRTVLPDVPALLIRTQSGFAALSLVCTHLGCTVEEKADGFVCPCHGSRYDGQGSVLQGPAAKGLRSLRTLTTQDGRLLLETD